MTNHSWACPSLRLFIVVMVIVTAASSVAHAQAELAERDVDDAIVRALRFLAREQKPSGGWCIDPNVEASSATALAIMAFMGAGHTPGDGPYGDALLRGINYVITHQSASGLLSNTRSHGPMYEHGICTLMLAEVSGMVPESQGPAVRRSLEQAVHLILSSQSVKKAAIHAGGWRYQPSSNDSDLSVTGWQLLALRAAKDIGCDVPADNIDRAIDYVKKCSARGGGFGYQPGAGGTWVLSGTGILALQVCGQEDCAEVHRGAELMAVRPIKYSDAWFSYGIYYSTIAMYKRGGQDWKNARPRLLGTLIVNQDQEGSWQNLNGNEMPFGRVYSTSMAVLALSVEYGYLPIYQR